MVDLNYDPSSICGPADMRVVQYLEEYKGHKLEAILFTPCGL